jgi:RimJ/RimL family protein N-acetyltransferase
MLSRPLNLNSAMLGTLAFSRRSIYCCGRVGFKEIGGRRQACIIGDRKYDVVLMDVLAEGFEQVYVQPFVDKPPV